MENTPEKKVTISTSIALISKDISYIKDSVTEIKDLYVTKIEFEPVKKIAFGFVGVIVMAVLGAMIALVVR